jgi:NADH-quinone oxidoreductase subunit B
MASPMNSPGVPSGLGENVLLTKLDDVANWARANSLWPMPFATACCGIELMATASSRFDLSRFGAEVMRFTPRQCDLMIVAGRVVMKMLPVLQRIWLQMPEPKWCISMGACACSGGVFDTYVPGCPPRPEQLIQAVLDLQSRIKSGGTFTGKEFSLRILPEGPPRFEPDEIQRFQDRNELDLKRPTYTPEH